MSKPLDTDKVAAVERSMVAGASPGTIVRELVAQHDLSERQAWRYIKAVQKTLKEAGPNGEMEMLQRLVVRRALNEGKLATASAAAARLRGLGADTASVERYRAAGDPPMDSSLEGIAWAQRILLLSMQEIALDPKMPAAQRRKELRDTSRCINALSDRDEEAEVMRKLKAEAKRIEKRTADPEMEHVTPTTAGGETLRAGQQ